MGAIGPGHHDSNIGRIEQRQIVGGIPQGQNLHLLSTQMSLQGGQRLAFADVWAQQVTHAVALHHRQAHPLNQGLKPATPLCRGRHKRHAAAPPLRLAQGFTTKPQQPLPFRLTEFIQRTQGLTQLGLKTLQLRFQRRPIRTQRQLPGLPFRSFPMHGATVFNDVGVMQPRLGAKAAHFLGRFAGAGNHRNPVLLQLTDQILGRRPVVAVIQQRAVEISHHPPRRLDTRGHG